ncbi:MAG: signal recognition particle-docking protein FtsY, partial [Candidatus Geothermarchaeales archaeon]
TAGRQHIDTDHMNELKKVIKVAEPDAVILVVDSLTGNDGTRQAEEFLQYTGFDAVVMTKMDADARGGIAIAVADRTSRPIIFVGTGQDSEDLEPFDDEAYVNTLLEGLP